MPYRKIQRFLTVHGKTVTVKNDEEKEVFDWQSALADSGILAALTFFTSLVGINLSGMHETVTACTAAAISAGVQFFTVLALKRGLKQNSSGE